MTELSQRESDLRMKLAAMFGIAMQRAHVDYRQKSKLKELYVEEALELIEQEKRGVVSKKDIEIAMAESDAVMKSKRRGKERLLHQILGAEDRFGFSILTAPGTEWAKKELEALTKEHQS